MKTFQQFCEDANIQEQPWWNPQVPDLTNKIYTLLGGKKSTPKPQTSVAKPKPKPSSKVLAYKNYKPGELNKSTGQFTPRAHSPEEQKRYGWRPVKTSSYGPGDTPSQSYNTGKDNVQRTASGSVFTPSSTGVAVPYKYRKGEVPKGTWAGTPSVPFGTKLQLTQKPSGTSTRVTNAPVVDTGNFGRAGEVNRTTGLDLMQTTARQLTGNQNLTPTDYGRRTVYVRTVSQPPSASVAKPKPRK